jgi:N-acetylglucosaminyl-diphospho-decaprenol L-rhamnosyltransferase
MMRNIGCVVVHHNNYPGVLATVIAILAGGVRAENLILVDNSEDSQLTTMLEMNLPSEVRLLTQTNSGYGQAANAGVAALIDRPFPPECILVSTHEAIPDVDAISTMLQVMHSNSADVVGPTLVDGADSGRSVWSTGGEVSGILNMPFHTRVLKNVSGQSASCVDRVWLDGAFCLYRTDTLSTLGFSEDYFLYFEEVDLHMQIRKEGGRVIWASNARVSQVSSGIPAYYLTRNMILFQSRYGNMAQRAVAPMYSMLRFILRSCAKERRMPDLHDLWRGLSDGRRITKNRKIRSERQAMATNETEALGRQRLARDSEDV